MTEQGVRRLASRERFLLAASVFFHALNHLNFYDILNGVTIPLHSSATCMALAAASVRLTFTPLVSASIPRSLITGHFLEATHFSSKRFGSSASNPNTLPPT